MKGERNEKYSIRHMSDAFEIDGSAVNPEGMKLLRTERKGVGGMRGGLSYQVMEACSYNVLRALI